ncbi:MAG: single-stranded DNA-binding protein [Phycisphaerales bacterium]|jgi:single-strand selective monofunctional uracil DNA glycosylase|nr:single-stranded DNA-binding protein [Phycisphaerales bacterium]
MSPLEICHRLSDEMDGLRFALPTAFVYNPLNYARDAVDQYLQRWAHPGVEVLLLGMNPGPWGMAQTGIPFGEVNAVRDYLGIDAKIRKPATEHPKRPILGLDCQRSEVSGRRLWGWAAERFPTADAFFEQFFIWNYCPLAFLEEGGRNRTPDKLPVEEREALFAPCDQALIDLVSVLKPGKVVGVGGFATKRIQSVLPDVDVGTILHPSPASPAANRGWAPQAERQLIEMGITLPAGVG